MISLRPYTVKDSAQLFETIDQVCADTPWMSTRKFIPNPSWLHALESDDCHYHSLLVAESKNEVVGWCRSFPAACEPRPSDAEFGIGLLPQYRNQGIGSELVMRSLEWANMLGLKKVGLTVSLGNSIAIHVFENRGFEPVSVQGDRMIMSVCLS